MRLLTSWLKEHLITNAKTDEICSLIEKIGASCESVSKFQTVWNQVSIVKIIEKRGHPNADKLNLYTILCADNSNLEIVCGDATLEVGDYVPYAPPGTIIPKGEFVLKVAKIRGIESPGMLCSASELMLPIESIGVLKCYANDFGKTIAVAYELNENEALIDLEITPNRGDLLSVRSIARNLAHHGFGLLKDLAIKGLDPDKRVYGKYLKIESEKAYGCCVGLVEHAVSMTDSKIAKRLQMSGYTVTNIDVVDLTNYVAHELGSPMHAFDFDKLCERAVESTLVITDLKKDEKFVTLKNDEITLDAQTLVIKNGETIVSWPGVIGGANSKTERNTNRILIETGIFKIDSIQRRKNKINTASAKKFEYGVDVANMSNAFQRFSHLLGIEICEYELIECDLHKKISINAEYISKVLGLVYSLDDIIAILEPRGFRFEKVDNQNALVEPPSYKYFDISTQNCIAEELIIGCYDAIESKNLLPIPLARTQFDASYKKVLKSVAKNYGFFEVCNFAITAVENEAFGLNVKNRSIKNASNQNYSILRGTLIPGLLKNVQWHCNNNYYYRNFFEHDLVFGEFENDKTQQEVFTAVSDDYHLLLKIAYHFFASVELITPYICENDIPWAEHGAKFLDTTGSLPTVPTVVGTIGKIKQNILSDFGLSHYFALELMPKSFEALQFVKYDKPSAHAPIEKDISFTLPSGLMVGVLLDVLLEFRTLLEYNFEVFDIYPSQNLEQIRNVGVRFSFELTAQNAGITSQQLNERMQKIKELVFEKLKI